MIVKGTKQLGNFKRGISVYIPKKRTALIPPDGLSLWLKADAGVSKFSYNYVSQIIISGTSNPSFAGTYTTSATPDFDFESNTVFSYSFTGPAGKTMSWSAGDGYFILSSSGEPSDSFYSYDGVNWTVLESYVSQIVITGFSGIYAGANGTYNGDENEPYFTRVGGGFFIDYEGLKDTSSENLIATAPANYSGSWTPTTYISSVTLSGAGNTSVNGIYTRSDTQINMTYVTYTKSGGGSIRYEGEWLVNGDSYVNGFNWGVGDLENGGVEPAPTNSFGTSVRSVGNPTSTSSSKPTGSISGSVTTATVNADYVTAWADQSGNGRNANLESIGNTSLVAIEGKSFVSFTNSFMVIPIIWNEVSLIGTIFAVARFNSSSTEDGSRIFSQQGEGDSNLFFTRGRIDTNNFYFASLGDAVISSVPANNDTNYLIGTTFDSSSASLFLNGTSVGTGPIEENIGYNEPTIGQGEPYKMAEIIVYNRVLTTEERQRVEAYLMDKYAITAAGLSIRKVAIFGAGADSSNGEYIEDGVINGEPFYAFGGNTIYWNGSQWFIEDNIFEDDSYKSDDLITWEELNAGLPVPSSALSYSQSSYIQEIALSGADSDQTGTYTWDGTTFIDGKPKYMGPLITGAPENNYIYYSSDDSTYLLYGYKTTNEEMNILSNSADLLKNWNVNEGTSEPTVSSIIYTA